MDPGLFPVADTTRSFRFRSVLFIGMVFLQYTQASAARKPSPPSKFSNYKPYLTVGWGASFGKPGDGDLGGPTFGVAAGSSFGYLDLGGALIGYQEINNPFSRDKVEPSEYFGGAELTAGLKFPVEKAMISLGLGGGYLFGLARTDHNRADTLCSLNFFGDACNSPDVTTYYNSLEISVFSLNPYVRLYVPITTYWGLGAKAQAWANRSYGLGVISIISYFGFR